MTPFGPGFPGSVRAAARRALAVAAALAALLSPRAADATTIPYRTDSELVAISDRVVHGRVLSVRSETAADSGRIYTVTRLAVLEDFTGVDEREIEIRELGGRTGDREMWIPGAARFAVGDTVIVCLERGPRGLRPVAMSFSAFHVVARNGAASLERFVAGATIVGGAADAPGARTVESFRQIAATVRGVASVAPAGGAALAATVAPGAPVFDSFTLLGGGMRWRQADFGTPVVWYRNPDRPSPLTSGSIDTEITTSLAAWTTPTSASLTLTYGGTRSAGGTSVSDVFCTSVNSGAGLISFEDPENNISSGVLAVGGGCSGAPVHTVNGGTQSFSSFTHGFVVFNDAGQLGSSYRVAPSFTRVLTHEIGHGIGLGHTNTTSDLMYPSCCYVGMPLPPAIGPDDLAGLNFIYPAASNPDPPVCTFTVSPANASYPVGGGSSSVNVTASHASCAWSASSNAGWVSITSGASGTGTGAVGYTVASNAGPARDAVLTVAGQSVAIHQDSLPDSDNDGLPDWWETAFGLSPASGAGNDGAAGDPDGDGRTNLQEYNARTHPRGFATRYLAEGAVNAFFSTEIALLNPGATPAITLVRIQPQDEAERSTAFTIAARTRRTLAAADLSALTTGSFSTVIESDMPLVIDRTMTWDARGYGAHAETALQAPSTTWYLAEGATAGEFSLFYLLQNPGTATASATVRFLRPAPLAPVLRTYTLQPNSRTTIPVDEIAELAATDVSAVITSTQPIIVERAMYLNRPGEPFSAGHESAGVTAPSETWFLAEGATGPFFELFVLIANPNATAANVTIDYLLPDGSTLSKGYAIGANSRYTIWVDEEQFPANSGNKALETASVSMRIHSTNGVPIIVERSMWWPQGAWYEAHNSPGTTVTGTRWGLAAGESGGPSAWQTYVLIANTSNFAGQARVTAYFEDSTTATATVPIEALSRTNVAMSSLFPSTNNRRFSVVVQSEGAPTPPQIVVERAMYSNASGVVWSAGTAAVATRLAP